MPSETSELLPAMIEARDRFMELVDELRPELHRYCARMTGSVFDGEDVVQDTLAKAYYALGQMREPPNLRPWLFRIAHNTAMDFLKRYEHKHVEPVSALPEQAEKEDTGVDPELVEAALTVFVALPPIQRAAIILKDVLGHSLEDVATTMGSSAGAVKAALSRARANIAPHAVSTLPGPRPLSSEERANLRRYVDLFNDRNWDELRRLLTQEAQLEQVSFVQRKMKDAGYFDRYAEILRSEDIRAELGYADGVPAIAMFRPASSEQPAYFVTIEWDEGRISRIRDFRYVKYIASDARLSFDGE